ncbi:MAG: formate dehydrogenase subunit gamma [Alcaligenaceae bacterium]|nr:formate dehydrogenase subunit gamma [Alcaligenaceae bacterium]
MNNVTEPRTIQRYSTSQRINHWIIAITFVLLAVSGLALFHPSFYWMSNLLGGGVWTRILHPFIGVVMFLCFFVFAARMFTHNFIQKRDLEWVRRAPEMLNLKEENLPEQGRYNGGQKLLFFTLIFLMLGLLATGVVMWRSYFSYLFPIELIRVASLLHAFFGFAIICAIIMHIYAGIWVKGSVKAMTRGTVTHGWAWKHHRAWLREIRDTPTHEK